MFCTIVKQLIYSLYTGSGLQICFLSRLNVEPVLQVFLWISASYPSMTAEEFDDLTAEWYLLFLSSVCKGSTLNPWCTYCLFCSQVQQPPKYLLLCMLIRSGRLIPSSKYRISVYPEFYLFLFGYQKDPWSLEGDLLLSAFILVSLFNGI